MSLPSLTPQQSAHIERIVQEVIRRVLALRTESGRPGQASAIQGQNRPAVSATSQPSVQAVLRSLRPGSGTQTTAEQRHTQPQQQQQSRNPFTTPVAARATTVEKLITAKTLIQLPKGTRELLVPQRAVITPLAKDEARDRSIQIIRDGSQGAAR